MSSIIRDISNCKYLLGITWKKKGGHENFGQKELRLLKDKYTLDYGMNDVSNPFIDEFETWIKEYDGDELSWLHNFGARGEI